MSVPEPKLDVETISTLLGSESRRRILRCLDGEQEVTLTELARAARGGSEREKSVESAKVHLHHVDLPKLVEHGVVEYDKERKTVSLLATGRQLVSYLDELENL